MKKRNNVLSNARGHWVLIIFILFGILFLVKNVFFNKNYSDEIIVLEKPKTYDLKLSSKARSTGFNNIRAVSKS